MRAHLDGLSFPFCLVAPLVQRHPFDRLVPLVLLVLADLRDRVGRASRVRRLSGARPISSSICRRDSNTPMTDATQQWPERSVEHLVGLEDAPRGSACAIAVSDG
jgi:hypothetical protein